MFWIFFKNIFRLAPPWSCGALSIALQQLVAALFFFGVAHALPAVQFAARPIATHFALDQDRKFGEEQHVFPLAGCNRGGPVFSLRDPHYQEGMPELSFRPQQQIAGLQIRQPDYDDFAVQARAKGDGGIKADRAAFHGSADPTHRAPWFSEHVGDFVADHIETMGMLRQLRIVPGFAFKQGVGESFCFSQRRPSGVQEHHARGQMENQPIAVILRDAEYAANVTPPKNCTVRRSGFEVCFLPAHNVNGDPARARRQAPTVPVLLREAPKQKETICPVMQ